MSTISIQNLSKTLKGHKVLDNVNLNFESGNIYGLVGRNGSGKTMLLRAICGLIIPDEGTISVNGKILHTDISFPPSCGAIIEHTELLPNFSAFENLKILGRINHIATDDNIKNALQSVGLDPNNKKKVKTYSLGMKQKLSIAQALFEDPDILILDEPTNALDEESVNTVREILLKEKSKNKIIIIASHNKDDIALLSDIIIMVTDGKFRK